jgi:tagaturonate reductase
VLEAMNDARVRSGLEAVWHDEVLPVFDAMGLQNEALTYIDSVRERFLNPFLAHRISDIAANHREKVKRRILPLVELADSLSLPAAQPHLRKLLASHDLPIAGSGASAPRNKEGRPT